MIISRFIVIVTLAYLSIGLASAQKSTRERIAHHKKWLQERRTLKKNIFLRTQDPDAGDRLLSATRYRPSLLNHRKKPLWNDTKTKYFVGNKLDVPNRQKSLQNDIVQQSIVNEARPDSENDVAYTMPTTATTTTTTKETVSVQNEDLRASRRTDLLTSTVAPTTPTMRLTSVTPISIPALADNNNVVKAVIESPVERTSINRTSTIRRVAAKAAWGRWHPWTICSRSCGGGVMSQTRECLSRAPSTSNNRTSNECIGLYKRYRICNEQSCPDHEIDFREQQCVQYNSQTFRGKTYTWEAYIKDDAECELNCKPIGMSYFATLNDTVIDGTTCYSPMDFARRNISGRAMCVDGICKNFGCLVYVRN